PTFSVATVRRSSSGNPSGGPNGLSVASKYALSPGFQPYARTGVPTRASEDCTDHPADERGAATFVNALKLSRGSSLEVLECHAADSGTFALAMGKTRDYFGLQRIALETATFPPPSGGSPR